MVIDHITEDDVWYTLPSKPEQEAVSMERAIFEKYLDTGNFSVMDKEQPINEVDAQRIADETFANEHLIPRESTYEIDGRRFIVDSVNLDFGSVSLQDVTFQNATGFPIFRSESIEFVRRLVEISEAQRSAELPTEPTVAEPKPELHNFHITDDHLGEGGAKAKFRMNMDAINLLKELEFDGRQATPEEQEVLAKYVGWGGLADAFDETKDNWKNEFAELYATLSPEEYAAARSSTLNAHYTSPTVIKAIYEAVGNMGFETGNILEPAMGILSETLFAFGYPQFDCFLPSLLSEIKQKKGSGIYSLNEVLFVDFPEYAAERAEVIGRSWGIDIRTAGECNYTPLQKEIKAIERAVDCLLEEMLSDTSSPLCRIFESELYERVWEQSDVYLRIRQKAMICQTQIWAESFNLVFE